MRGKNKIVFNFFLIEKLFANSSMNIYSKKPQFTWKGVDNDNDETLSYTGCPENKQNAMSSSKPSSFSVFYTMLLGIYNWYQNNFCFTIFHHGGEHCNL